MQKGLWAGTAPWFVALALALRAGDAWAAPSFTQQSEWTGSASASELGYSVAVQGDTAVVGAPNANRIGEVFVFARTGTTWTQQALITPPDGAVGDAFGNAVSLSGSTLVVGASQKASATGAAYVFVRSGATWAQQAELTASDGGPAGQFAYSVVVSGNAAFFGAFGHSTAYAFVRSGTTWSQQQELRPGDPTGSDEFGGSLALGGNALFVGAPNKATHTGAVYVFTNSGGAWTQQQKLLASDGATNDGFGTAVAVSGTTAWIGAPGHSGHAGAAYVFTGSGASWSQQQVVLDTTGASNDFFGSSIALAPGTAIVGAPGFLSRGTAYVYTQSGVPWSQQQQIAGADTSNNDSFGGAVALDAVTAVLGAYPKNSSTGAAYVFITPFVSVPALGAWVPALAALLLLAGVALTASRRRSFTQTHSPEELP
jgi:hypothetical protein